MAISPFSCFETFSSFFYGDNQSHALDSNRLSDVLGAEQARLWADDLLKGSELPQYSDITIDEYGKITIIWESSPQLIEALSKIDPEFIRPNSYMDETLGSFRLEIDSYGNSHCYANITRWYTFDDWVRFDKEIQPDDVFGRKIDYPKM
jgi:hypothetical protein